MNWFRNILWGLRVRRCWKQAEGDYGQFLGNIGCYIAYGKLPPDILERGGLHHDMPTTKDIPILKLKLPLGPVIYFGCSNTEIGHYMWAPLMSSKYDKWSDPNHRQLCKLDGKFAPTDTNEEGQAWYHTHIADPRLSDDVSYNVISWWDRSVDHRQGSHSTFLIVGEPLHYLEALAKCKAAFPEVFARFKYEIRLRRDMAV